MHINFHKSNFIPVNIDVEEAHCIAHIFIVQQVVFPLST
jgi:hypothetical protein